jgi:hypothetical protein
MIVKFILLLSAISTAAEPPPLPEPSSPVLGQCSKSYAFEEGDEVPAPLLDGRVISCSGVVIPTSKVADLLKQSAYAKDLHERYKLDTSDLESRVTLLEAENERLRQKPVWVKSPSGQRWIGRVEVALLASVTATTAIYISKSVE